MTVLRLLLPSLAVVERHGGPELAMLRARGDRLPDGDAGRRAAALRVFALVPARVLPIAALTRQADVGDAGDAVWLRADPGHAQADMSSLRLLRSGDLDLDATEASALVRSLKPLFGDAGYELSAPTPARWFLRGILSAEFPDAPDPAEILGDDLQDHLPAGAAGAKWRRLLNEAQILLHQHEVNRARAARGALPANTLWFWGGGALPQSVASPFARLASADEVLLALGRRAGLSIMDPERYEAVNPLPATVVESWSPFGFRRLLDAVLPGRMRELRRGLIATLELDCLSGERWTVTRRNLWRLWRRPAVPLPARPPED